MDWSSPPRRLRGCRTGGLRRFRLPASGLRNRREWSAPALIELRFDPDPRGRELLVRRLQEEDNFPISKVLAESLREVDPAWLARHPVGTVRTWDREGRPRTSGPAGAEASDAAEIGTQVDQEAEACTACHLNEKKRDESRMTGRPRVFTGPDGKRLLGTTAVIVNEPSCSSSSCHVHDKNHSVLGVLDIVYPLDKIDKTIRASTFATIEVVVVFP